MNERKFASLIEALKNTTTVIKENPGAFSPRDLPAIDRLITSALKVLADLRRLQS
jgi:hypothetical protein